MSQRVDAEGSLLNKENSKDSSIDESAPPVTPAEAADEHWEDHTHEDENLEVVLVLPDDDWVFVEIGNIGSTNSLWVLLHQHPSEMRVHQAFADRIWIFLGVGVSVMSTMITSPPSDRALDSTTANPSEEDSKRQSGRVRGMCP